MQLTFEGVQGSYNVNYLDRATEVGQKEVLGGLGRSWEVLVPQKEIRNWLGGVLQCDSSSPEGFEGCPIPECCKVYYLGFPRH